MTPKCNKVPYETYLNGTKFGILSDYQNLGHRHTHYFPQIIIHVLCFIMTLSIYYQYSKL